MPLVKPSLESAILAAFKKMTTPIGSMKAAQAQLSKDFANNLSVISTGSGTDALHLAYLLANIKKDDEVIAPVFTCTATNIPLLYIGAKIKFADLDKKTMNICVKSVKKLITKKTKAIICVHYGGLPCDLKELQELANKFKILLRSRRSWYSSFF